MERDWLEVLRPAMIASGIIDSTPLDVRFAAWFAHLNESQRQVLAWRYGLTEGQDLTLEETGEQLDLTRERVRQIEHKALETPTTSVRARAGPRIDRRTLC